MFGTFFVNTIAPSLNLAGTSLVVDTAHKQGISAGKATSAALLMQLCIDSGFTCIMILTFTALSLTVGLDPGWLALGMLAIVPRRRFGDGHGSRRRAARIWWCACFVPSSVW